MPTYWTSAKSLTFLANRKWRLVRNDNNIGTRIARLNIDKTARGN